MFRTFVTSIDLAVVAAPAAGAAEAGVLGVALGPTPGESFKNVFCILHLLNEHSDVQEETKSVNLLQVSFPQQ